MIGAVGVEEGFAARRAHGFGLLEAVTLPTPPTLPTLRVPSVVKVPKAFANVRVRGQAIIANVGELISSAGELKVGLDSAVQAICASTGPYGAAVGAAYSVGSTIYGIFSGIFTGPPSPPMPSLEGIKTGDFQASPFRSENRGVILAHVLSNPKAADAQAESERVTTASIEGLETRARNDWRDGLVAVHAAVMAGQRLGAVRLREGMSLGGLAAFAGRMDPKTLFDPDNHYIADKRQILAVAKLAELGARREAVKDILFYYQMLRNAEGYRHLVGERCPARAGGAAKSVWYRSVVTGLMELASTTPITSAYQMDRPREPKTIPLGPTGAVRFSKLGAICASNWAAGMPLDKPWKSPAMDRMMEILAPRAYMDVETGFGVVATLSDKAVRDQIDRLGSRVWFPRWSSATGRWNVNIPTIGPGGVRTAVPIAESPAEAMAFAIKLANAHPTWHRAREAEIKQFGLDEPGGKPSIGAAIKKMRKLKKARRAAARRKRVRFTEAFKQVARTRQRKQIVGVAAVSAAAVSAYLLLG